MNTFSLRMLLSQPLRLIITVAGISLCIILMLFLLGIYNGVVDGSVQYVRHNTTDLWVVRRSAENILRGTSILNEAQNTLLRQQPSVQDVSPVILLLGSLKQNGRSATIFLCGYDLSAPSGGPPIIESGRGLQKMNDIVLDRSFALKNKIAVGDKVTIMDDTLHVVGLSAGTNMFVVQYGFMPIQKVHELMGSDGIYTCFLIKLRDGIRAEQAGVELQALMPECGFYTHDVFLENNIREMQSGIVPVLYSISGISAIVLTTILSLILSINILEKKKEFAVMKILGCPHRFIPTLIISQALTITLTSSLVAFALYFPLNQLIEHLAPEISTKMNPLSSVIVLITALVMSMISASLAVRRLRHIYPLEVFQ